MAGPVIHLPRMPRLYSLARWSLILFVLALFASFYLFGGTRYFNLAYLHQNLDGMEQSVQRHILLSLLVFVLVYIVVTNLPIPTAAAMSILAGALFGRWLGTGIVSIASTASATLCFLASRFLFHDWVARRWGTRLQRLQAGLERNGGFYLFTLRLVPFVPFFLINLGMGMSRIRLWRFVWVSWLGMLPLTFLYANAGREIGEIQSPKDVLSVEVVASLLLLGIAPLVLRKVLKRAVTRSPELQAKAIDSLARASG
jgi:uncharacterized membrane protein YdjX (TVP38/TMEM64 family)